MHISHVNAFAEPSRAPRGPPTLPFQPFRLFVLRLYAN